MDVMNAQNPARYQTNVYKVIQLNESQFELAFSEFLFPYRLFAMKILHANATMFPGITLILSSNLEQQPDTE